MFCLSIHSASCPKLPKQVNPSINPGGIGGANVDQMPPVLHIDKMYIPVKFAHGTINALVDTGSPVCIIEYCYLDKIVRNPQVVSFKLHVLKI
jgi:hypothetical protein